MFKEKFRANVSRIAERVQVVFQAHIGFILTLFLLNFTTMAWSLLNEDKVEVFISYGFSQFFTSFIVAWLVHLVCKFRWLQIAVKTCLLFVSGAVFTVEFFTMYNYNILIGTGIVNSIFETNLREATEFLRMYVGPAEIAMVLAAIGVVCFICKRRLIDGACRRPRFNQAALWLLFLGFCYMIRMVSCYGDFFLDNRYVPFQRAYASTKVALKNIEAYDELTSKLNADVHLEENQSKIKNIVFILGESTNRNHMGLYGYYLPNTPNLQKMKDDGDLYVFNDVISPHSTTIAVLSKLFTFCHLEAEKDWYEYNNLIDIANAAGYKTFWLSNQESAGIWGNVAQIFAQHSSEHAFTRLRDSREDYGIVDGELFPLIEDALQRTADKNFFVIHLMGSHGLYYNRFPYAFSKFSKDDVRLDVNDEKKTIIAQYDNSIYYNDYVVNEIIKKFKDRETLVVYVSDHGEAVYDEQNFSGHIEENPSRHMIEIPLLMWASPAFKEKYPDKMSQIRYAEDHPYMSDDMIHTFLDLMDIRTAEYEPARSIVNEQFDCTRKRIFNGRDYDAEIKNGDGRADAIQNKE